MVEADMMINKDKKINDIVKEESNSNSSNIFANASD